MNLKVRQERIPGTEGLIDQQKPKKKRKKQTVLKGGRWTVAVGFLFTLLVIAGFYLQAELPVFWQKITSPLVISNLSKEERFDPSLVLSEIENLTKDLRGSYGVYVFRLTDKKDYGFNEDKVFPAASLMKLPVMLALYQEAEKGKIDLETKYTLIEKDKRRGAGILQGKPVGSLYTYKQLIELMGQHSDNTAFAVLRKVLGDKEIEKVIDDLEMSKTSLRGFETSPKDMGRFFQKLYQGDILSPKSRDEFLDSLVDTSFEDWLPQGVPEDIKVAHKIGQDLGIFSDAGIIFTSRPFVLIIMSKNARQKEADEVLVEITEKVWAFEMEKGSL